MSLIVFPLGLSLFQASFSFSFSFQASVSFSFTPLSRSRSPLFQINFSPLPASPSSRARWRRRGRARRGRFCSWRCFVFVVLREFFFSFREGGRKSCGEVAIDGIPIAALSLIAALSWLASHARIHVKNERSVFRGLEEDGEVERMRRQEVTHLDLTKFLTPAERCSSLARFLPRLGRARKSSKLLFSSFFLSPQPSFASFFSYR